jgi:hypothetical protein
MTTDEIHFDFPVGAALPLDKASALELEPSAAFQSVRRFLVLREGEALGPLFTSR